MSAAIVAVIGLFGSVLTFILNKRAERKVELRKIKENQYIDFFESITRLKVAEDNKRDDLNASPSARIQTIYLVGSREVQEALRDFLSTLTPGRAGIKNQDELFANLVKAMKKDLYGKNEKSLESIRFTVFKS